MASKINWKQFWLELVAVLIGVTLAFQLQNWNAKSKDKKEAKLYLQAISSDLESDIAELVYLADTLSDNLKWSTRLTENLGMRNYNSPTLFPEVLYGMYNISAFRPKNSTYESMKSAGELNLISDFEIRNELNSLYQWKYDELAIYDDGHAEQFYGRVYPYMSKRVQWSSYSSFASSDFIEDVEFGNLAFAAHFTNKRKAEAYSEAEQMAIDLKAKIDSILN